MVKVISNSFEDENLKSKYSHVYYRKVENLGWLPADETFPQYQKTLERLTNPHTLSWKFINYWHHTIRKNSYMDNIIELLKHKKQIILQGAPGTGKTRLAKEIAYNLITGYSLMNIKARRNEQEKKLIESEFYKMVQFHPAYSYEDFVRGITVKTNGPILSYTPENKTFAQFAKNAFEAYHQKTKEHKDYLVEKEFPEFVKSIEEELNQQKDEGKKEGEVFYRLKTNEHISIEDIKQYEKHSHFKMHGFSPQFKHIEGYLDYVLTGEKNNSMNNKWVDRVFDEFKYFLEEKKVNLFPDFPSFVLIIDEINRANLPAVLGELIYALEYRGEPVESMYEIEDEKRNKSNQIVIPDNLYIIGTMNTADRSVGHIDYAIRRRFAFVDVLPTTEPLQPFAEELFFKIAGLFIKNPTEVKWQAPLFEPSEFLSPEFRPEDVMIGHSYFITSEDEKAGKTELKQRFKYEILPILKEYLKDGVLLPDAENEIKELIKNY